MAALMEIPADLLNAARAVGGEIDAEFDRQTATSEVMPFYSVVGKNSKDSSYAGVLNGRTVEVSRAGSFRRKNGEGENDYFDELELAIIDARTSYALFAKGENQPVARGISTKGFYDAVWTDGSRYPKGTPVESSPHFRWYWEKNGGPEGKVLDPETGRVIAKEDCATSSLLLWCWDIGKDEFCLVQFSAGALKHYREFVRGVEAQGVKMHSLLWKLTTRQVDNGASAAPSFVPELAPIRVLTPDEYDKADSQRTTLVGKALALAEGRQEVLPPANQKALPTKSAFASPPDINVGPADADPSDIFASVD